MTESPNPKSKLLLGLVTRTLIVVSTATLLGLVRTLPSIVDFGVEGSLKLIEQVNFQLSNNKCQ